jgi:hypothetical protein
MTPGCAHAPGTPLSDPSWKALTDALGSNPADHHVTGVERRFDAYVLKGLHSPATSASYEPRVYQVYSGVPYYRPDGWWQFQVPPWCVNSELPINFDEIANWPVAYHGTACDKLPSILSIGLRKPGEVPWVGAEHGCAGAGATGAVYVSPSLWYELKRSGAERWVQVVLKLRIRPNSYRAQGNTLLDRHWNRQICLDPDFPNNDCLEWLLEGDTYQRNDAVIVAVMIREIGACANSETCGYCPLLDLGTLPPEFAWTSYLQRRLLAAGFTC